MPVLPTLTSTKSYKVDRDESGRPSESDNNTWYEYNSSDTVFIFVHGIFSNNRDCWYSDKEGGKYWPNMISEDEIFGAPSIFLGGYYTEMFNSGDYVLSDAANELYRSLSISKCGKPPVLDKKKIIFIAHSTGGILVRHMLVRKLEMFKDKQVILALMASPSIGSRDASRLKYLAKLANQKLGAQLAFDHPLLQELDRDFKDLVNEKKISGLVGVEGIENHFIVKWLFFIRRKVVVTEDSACRYFGPPQRMGNTDHFSIVKPDSRSHPAYELIQQVYEKHFRG